jgi:hypothetical protein
MNRRTFLGLLVLGAAGVGALFAGKAWRPPGANPPGDPEDEDRRVRFVCCDDHGTYSPGVYMRVGGGRAAFETVREAAPFLRADDPGSAAAGLCGFLFQRFGYHGQTSGTLALEPPPQAGPQGTIDWAAYGADGDMILINVHTGSAKCCFGTMAGHEIHDLKLGGSRLKAPEGR